MATYSEYFERMIGQSEKIKEVITKAKKFANLNAPLLIQGETGTGKDVFAKACHNFSDRRAKKFIAVNCAGLPAEDAETEMFGHRSSSSEAVGFFEYANGGTVLLDSISELSLEMQAKLLRFLNDGSFRRVGEDKEIQVDVRVICTSQKPLAQLVAEGKVREDLYHRLNVLTLNLPPLRERKEDIPLLADHFIAQVSEQLGVSKLEYDNAFLQALENYRWPGNLRELYNAIYRACTLSPSYRLSVKELNLPDASSEIDTLLFEESTLEQMMNQYEAQLLQKFYAEYPSTRKLAQRLGLSHTAVANKLRQYGLTKNGNTKDE
ncbi:sigma 54-interacting transcriptional regulator [Mannheimia varigena]|nr:sigma 54-interacting transcriptional regulator [Mannheimia varigena]QLD32908.1 sigma 54-interacting transcriptional regulator [Mannheimia varigena]